MTTLPTLLAGLPTTTSPLLLPISAAPLPLYTALVDETPVSVVVLREADSANSRIFISADTSVFHELARADVVYRHDTPGFQPILTRTPGLISMAVLDNQHSVTVLKNDPGHADRLQTFSFLRNKNLPAKAALFVFPDGEAPAFEGGLALWWDKMSADEKPTFQIPAEDLAHVVSRIGHKINNGMSPIISYADLMEPALSSLKAFFDVLSKSDAVNRAIAGELRRLPEMREALDEIAAQLPPSLVTDENPIELLRALIEDIQSQSRAIADGSQDIISFVRTVQHRIPLEVTIGAADARELIRECEEGIIQKASAPVVARIAPSNDQVLITAPLLLVDDEPEVRQMLVSHLGRKGFANIVPAASLAEALQAAEKLQELGVLLTDFNLSPTETGLDLARQLRKRFPKLRVALITGNPGQLNDQLTTEEAAIFDRFTKPMDVSSLAERLRALFQDSSPAPMNATRHETFSSDGR